MLAKLISVRRNKTSVYFEIENEEIACFKGKDVILFGAGSCGARALEEIEKIGSNIIGFADNNRTLANTDFMGYKILMPEEIVKFKDVKVIITSTYVEEIKQQLKDMNCPNVYVAKVGVLRAVLEKEKFKNVILSNEEANQKILEGLTGKNPFFIGRLGSVELECLCNYLYFLNRSENNEIYPNNLKVMMNVNAGFFPVDDHQLDKFVRLYLDNIEEMDIIWSMWFSKFENKIYSELYKDKVISIYDDTAFPIYNENPWTSALNGKKVLVIHPFAESIKENYAKKHLIFKNSNFMPEFELNTLKAVQSIAGSKTKYLTWFEALDSMKEQMNKMDFDVALIGAGAYGLPLAAYAKKIGKKSVHIGGLLQLFFGIKGKAWNKMGIYNDYWTKPKEEEIPTGYMKVEAGRYW